MSRHSSITGMPSSAKIIAALIAGKQPIRRIATQFSVSQSSLRRLLKTSLLPAAARVAAEQDLSNGEGVMAAIKTEIDRLKMLDDALDRQMRDPEDNTRYTAAVDALDCEVTYFEEQPSEKDPDKTVKVRRKASLQSLLLSKVPNAIQVIVRRDDSRRIFIQLHEAVGSMLDRLAKVLGLIRDGSTTVNVNIQQQRYEILGEVRAALSRMPQEDYGKAIEAIAVYFEEKANEEEPRQLPGSQ